MSVEEPRAFYDHWSSRMSKAKSSAPDAARGFGALFQSVMKEGALGVREKELVALGIGLALRCDPCVYAHVQKAKQAGARRGRRGGQVRAASAGRAAGAGRRGGPTARAHRPGRTPAPPGGGGRRGGAQRVGRRPPRWTRRESASSHKQPAQRT